MNRVLVALPGLLNDIEQADGWRPIVSHSKIFKVTLADCMTPEVAWLGLDPLQWSIPQGPITMSALKQSPPDRAVSMHASFGSIDDSHLIGRAEHWKESEISELKASLHQLDTKKLIFVPGHGVDHGLVWLDGSQEMGLTSFEDALGRPLSEEWPKGDADPILKHWIEGCIEILNAHEVNRRRLGEGLHPINLVWPWGFGTNVSAVNLPLVQDRLVTYYTSGIRMEGLVRIFGHVQLPSSRAHFGHHTVTFPHFMDVSDPDEMLHGLKKLASQIGEIGPEEEMRLTVIALGDGKGLGFNYDSRRRTANSIPFAAEMMEEELHTFPLHEAVERALKV